ncbi:Kinesin-16 [Giardia lamblia P15]|uniref:Kinesin-like protein n=1 Tax=Giardia intestinalis (strain P15) TaxID=658858 RepID=E1F934_GIAIA|nr:Kinesin-16 [Giardia lamblia P15]
MARREDANFRVVVRIRPLIDREKAAGDRIIVSASDAQVVIKEQTGNPAIDTYAPQHRFTFDRVFGPSTTQEEIFNSYVKDTVELVLQGINSTIFTYGQTSSGKTYTMVGGSSPQTLGIVPRAVVKIFDLIALQSGDKTIPYSHELAEKEHLQISAQNGDLLRIRRKYLLWVSYMQIYNESINDLLSQDPTKDIKVRENSKNETFCDGLTEHICKTPADILRLVQRGNSVRSTELTRMNELSSRSHAILSIAVEQAIQVKNTSDRLSEPMEVFKMAKLNLVDLAGSERVSQSKVDGQRLEEAKRINSSLTVLGNVISALIAQSQGKRSHIPYRDSKLTRVLQDSLGGNCISVLCTNISPASSCFQESLNTLKFADRAKQIKNKVGVNETVDDNTLLKRYETEIKALRSELERRRVSTPGTFSLGQEQSARALQYSKSTPKLSSTNGSNDPGYGIILAALEQRTRESLQEKKERRLLEEKIATLESQIGSTGLKGALERNLSASEADVTKTNSLPCSPQTAQAKARDYTRMKQEYERRLHLLEKERKAVSGGSLALYENVLMKQKDLLLAISERLSDREEAIETCTEELTQRRTYERVLNCKASMLKEALRILQDKAQKMLPEAGLPTFVYDDETLNAGALAKISGEAGEEVSFDELSGSASNDRFSRSKSIGKLAVLMEANLQALKEANNNLKKNESEAYTNLLERQCDKIEESVEKLTEELVSRKAELTRLQKLMTPDGQVELVKSKATGGYPALLAHLSTNAELLPLRNKITAYSKESTALQTVIDKKIAPLVTAIKQYATQENQQNLCACYQKLMTLIDATVSALNMTADDYSAE